MTEAAEDDENEGENPEIVRPRGRKVGVRQMESVYFPEFKAIFASLEALLRKRVEAKKIEITEIVKEALGILEIIDQAAAIARQAREKFSEANRLYQEGKELRKEALNLANSSKIIELELKDGSSGRSRYSYRDDDDDDEFETVRSINVKFTHDFEKIVNASMLLQREHLDFKYLEYQEKEAFGRLRECITMEQCVAILKESRGLVSALEVEHKRSLEKQEATNAVIERVRDKREDCNT